MPATCTGTLACPATDSAGGWQRSACRYLDRNRSDLFRPLPRGIACTEMYGGADEAEVIGVVDGARVAVRLARTNGCEISRWDLHSPLWGVGTGAGGSSAGEAGSGPA